MMVIQVMVGVDIGGTLTDLTLVKNLCPAGGVLYIEELKSQHNLE